VTLPSQFELIDRILTHLGDRVASSIVVPPGDDAAVWRPEQALILAHTDSVIEGTHWTRQTMSLVDVGWRVVAVNVSDIAAMGAHPRYVLVTLMVGPSMTERDIDAAVEGIAASCRIHEVQVIGGGVNASATTAFSVTVLGEAGDGSPPPLLTRRAARPGDTVAVSGWIGASAAGRELIRSGRASPSVASLLRAHRRPVARVQLGKAAAAAGVRSGIDVSDGLVQDLGHIAQRSAVGIEIDLEALPLHPEALSALGAQRAADLALGGGEDYELVLVGRAATLVELSMPGHPVTIIGRTVERHPGEVHVFDGDGARYIPPASGWDHLRMRAAGEVV
jgi:thiamine-monophosphate kinase